MCTSKRTCLHRYVGVVESSQHVAGNVASQWAFKLWITTDSLMSRTRLQQADGSRRRLSQKHQHGSTASTLLHAMCCCCRTLCCTCPWAYGPDICIAAHETHGTPSAQTPWVRVNAALNNVTNHSFHHALEFLSHTSRLLEGHSTTTQIWSTCAKSIHHCPPYMHAQTPDISHCLARLVSRFGLST